MKDRSNMIWIDLEMTGLDTQRDYIIEIASIVTDKNLNIIDEGPNLVINHPDEVLNSIAPLCGNTICQDRRFLARCMPELESFCHYRSIDVTSIRELGKRWYFEDIDNFQKNSNHRALDDIRDSIEELRYYRKTIFKL